MSRFNPPEAIRPQHLFLPSVADEFPLIWYRLRNLMVDVHIREVTQGTISNSPHEMCSVIDEDRADAGMKGWIYAGNAGFTARCGRDPTSRQDAYVETLAAGDDPTSHRIKKYISGAITTLGTESTGNISELAHWPNSGISTAGTTIKGWRDGYGTPKITAGPDTDRTTGGWGCMQEDRTMGYVLGYLMDARYVPAYSPTARPTQFFEVPVIGTGVLGDEYRADLDGIDPGHGALIKSKPDGTPADFTAIVRFFDNAKSTERNAAITALRGRGGVVEFADAAAAITRAKELDALLTDADFQDKSADEMVGWTP